MIFFPDMPNYKSVPGNPDLIELEEDYAGPDIDGKQTAIRAGFRCDGGSIPRFCWPFIFHPFEVPFIAAAVTHDGGYRIKAHKRVTCDKRLYKACRMLKIGQCKSWLIYKAVRIMGRWPWKRYTDAVIANAKKFVSCLDA